MKKVQYFACNGRVQWRPVFNSHFEQLCREEGHGFCLACGDHADRWVEPDARQYTCEVCGKAKVYGLEELLLMGLAR